MQLNQKILNPHGNSLSPPRPPLRTQILGFFTSLQKLKHMKVERRRRQAENMKASRWGGYEEIWSGGGKRWRKKMSQKKEIYVEWRAYSLFFFFFFFVLMSSRWAPTLATQWQPRTSIMTGEWLLLQRWGRMTVKMLGRGRWRRPRDWNGK